MDSALKLQLDVKNNAQDLQNFALDLRNWEDEMKRKENELNDKYQETSIPPPRNKIKRSKPGNEKNSNKPKKISAYDYSAWDKFDVEKACAEIDEEDSGEKSDQEEAVEEGTKNKSKDDDKEEESNLNDSKRFSLIDEAFYEKEMGNKFVKEEKWADAIKCYTNAINLDPDNAIYYANRSLCFLKLKNFKSSETDATTAIQLDKNYVKAYQRRAYARQALGQLKEALADYEQILKLEPKNALARVEFNKIDTKLKKEIENFKAAEKKVFDHKNMFKNVDKIETQKSVSSLKKQTVDSSKKVPSKPDNCPKVEIISSKPTSGAERKAKTESANRELNNKNFSPTNGVKNVEMGDGDKVASKQLKPARGGVFKPLPEGCRIISPVTLPPHKRSKKPLRKINILFTDKDEDLLVDEKTKSLNVGENESEKTNPPESVAKEEPLKCLNKAIEDERLKNERLSCEIPKTAIQFQKCWKILKRNPEEAYSYLKKIPGRDLPQIFENSLESDFFSDLITFLAGDEVKKEPDIVYHFLLGLSKVKRFTSLILFMSDADKRCLKKAIAQLGNSISNEDTTELLRLYELKL